MNPLQYEDRYHNLVVYLGGLRLTTVDVHRYQNNDAKLKANAFLGNQEALKHKDQLIGKMGQEIKQEKKAAAAKIVPGEAERFAGPAAPAVAAVRQAVASAVHLSNAEVLRRLRPVMMAVHSGKGSPEEIADALHLVARYGLYDKKIADEAAGVRDYCDRYIGLDCNGFVGNYARATGRAKGPSTPIPSFAPKHALRAKIEDVAADDVMVWPDYGHITVIDSIGQVANGPDGKPARDCVVVESTAANPSGGASTAHGGLQHSTYSIRSVGADKIFVVERPKGGHRSKVYIAPLS
jgi:hypothetical protein